MAVLTDPQRAAIWSAFMAELSGERTSTNGITKADIRAAIDALDSFMNTNASAINSAIPLPARNLSTAIKARMLMFVVRQRYITGA